MEDGRSKLSIEARSEKRREKERKGEKGRENTPGPYRQH
jgi:hypothetical protein